MQPFSALSPNAPSGHYSLNEENNSSVIIMRNALKITEEQTTELRDFMCNKVKPTPNPYNPKTFLKRLQTTFGALYNFGQEVTSQPPDDTNHPWPEAVKTMLRVSQDFAESRGIARDLYNGAHVTFYRNGDVSLEAHSDDEEDMVKEMPIISGTLLSGDKKPRPFSIYKKAYEGKKKNPIKLVDIILGHGDVIVMLGRMQEFFWHGVEKAKPQKEFANAERINLTVRAFTPEAVKSAISGTKRKWKES